MHYAKIRGNDIANGAGIRVSLFVSGCRKHCKGCFQPETWDFNYGEPYTKGTEEYILNLLLEPFIEGLTVLGGEPMEPENQRELIHLFKRVKSELPDKTIWVYSGYTLEELLNDTSNCRTEVTDELLGLIDVLVDGAYVEELSDVSLKFRGSSNQRIIDMRNLAIK